MKKFSEPRESNKGSSPTFDLPNIPASGRRPPVLTLDQYFAWNVELSLAGEAPPTAEGRCHALFEWKP